MRGAKMQFDAREDFKHNLHRVKKNCHFDHKYIVELKAEIFIAAAMSIKRKTILQVIDEIGFDEPVRSVLMNYVIEVEEGRREKRTIEMIQEN